MKLHYTRTLIFNNSPNMISQSLISQSLIPSSKVIFSNIPRISNKYDMINQIQNIGKCLGCNK